MYRRISSIMKVPVEPLPVIRPSTIQVTSIKTVEPLALTPTSTFESRSALSKSILGSQMSDTSAGKEIKALNKAWKELDQDRWAAIFSACKLVSAAFVPMTAIVVLCALAIIGNVAVIQSVILRQEDIVQSKSIGLLVTAVQQERGMTCVFLDSQANSASQLNVLTSLIGLYGMTNSAIGNLSTWMGTADDGPGFESRGAFQKLIGNYRQTVAGLKLTCNEVLSWYTNLTTTLIKIMTRGFQQTQEGQFWLTVIGFSDLLKASDLFGLARAIGTDYYILGKLPNASYALFVEYYSQARKYLDLVLAKSTSTNEFYSLNITNSSELFAAIDILVNEISWNNQSKQNFGESQIWFNNMTAYSYILYDLQQEMIINILDYLNTSTAVAQSQLIAVIVVVVLISILCPPVMLWYTINNRKLMNNMQSYVMLVFSKTEELDKEKKRTETILNQLLPPMIVVALKRGERVSPESFESVTIYFSDVKGFTALSSRSSPIEVVDMLNDLYSSFDNILDRYDVYKVETIGDAYMVVSGVPRRNGNRHAAEICTVALEILQMMDEFYIPHMPTEKLLIRIGVHTGPCVAGVVGIKMPRYCLFGQTVSISQRLESTGAASRIHISGSAHSLIQGDADAQFDTISRGTVEITATEKLETHWLLGKKNFPFRIDLERSAQQPERYPYWKI